MTAAKSEVKKKKPKVVTKTYRRLTPAQRAEAAALWRTGTVTLADPEETMLKIAQTRSNP